MCGYLFIPSFHFNYVRVRSEREESMISQLAMKFVTSNVKFSSVSGQCCCVFPFDLTGHLDLVGKFRSNKKKKK